MKRYVLSGYGKMGRLHKQVADSLGWRCVGVADPRFGSASGEADIEAVPLFQALKEVPPNLEFDAVVLSATTPSRMGDLDWSLTHAGHHMTFTEKPFANSMAEALRLQKLAVGNNKSIVVNHQRRFFPLYRQVKEIIDRNELGALCAMQVAGSNFGLGNNVTHFVELATYLFAHIPKSVRACLDDEPVSSFRGIEFEDASGRIFVDFDDSRMLFVDFQNRRGHGQTVVLGFEHGQVVVDEIRGRLQIDARKFEDFSLPSWKYASNSEYREIPGLSESAVEPVRRLFQEVSSENWQESLNRSVWAVNTAVAAHFSHFAMNGQEVLFRDVPIDYTTKVFPWA